MTQEAAVPAGYLEQVRRIAREEAANVYRSAPLRNATISGGGITVKGGFLRVLFPQSLGGSVGTYFGDIVEEGTDNYIGTGLLVQGADVTQDIAQFRTDAASGNKPIATIWGADGASVLYTDVVGGMGLSRPFLANSFVPSRFADWSVNTTSASFETLFTSNGYRTHAGIMAWTRASMDTAGSTGEIRVLVNGNQLDTPDVIGFAQTLTFHGPTVLPGASYDFLTVEIQGRVASGAGAFRVGGGGWMGRA